MIFDFRRKRKETESLCHDNNSIQICHQYKYLGVIIDDKLNFREHIMYICSKARKKIFCIYIMNNLRTNSRIKTLAYKSLVESTILYGLHIIWRNLTKEQKKMAMWCEKRCKKMGIQLKTGMEQTIDLKMKNNAKKWMENKMDVIIHKEYRWLKHMRRLSFPYCRTKRYKNSFVPASIELINSENIS